MKKIPRFKSPVTVRELISAFFSQNNKKNGRSGIEEFTQQFAKYIGVECAVFVPSARVGLAALLHALELPKNGEIILPALTHPDLLKMMEKFDLRPRLVDIHPTTYCIDIDQIKAAINPSTVAILPVHIYGRACNMGMISKLADEHGLVIIEDCAQACGSSHAGKRLGSFGKGAIFSLGPFKHVCALGTGMVVTNSPQLAAKMSSYVEQLPQLGNLSLMKRFLFTMAICSITKPIFWNTLMDPLLRLYSKQGIDPIEKMTTESPNKKKKMERQTQLMPKPLQGIVGIAQLAKLDDLNGQRIRNGNRLLEYLQDIDNIKIPASAPEGENVYLSFAIQVQNTKIFRRRMLSFGVDTHPGDMTFVPHLSGVEEGQEYKIAENAIKSMVHLPVYPQMDESDVSRVAEAVKLAARDQLEIK